MTQLLADSVWILWAQAALFAAFLSFVLRPVFRQDRLKTAMNALGWLLMLLAFGLVIVSLAIRSELAQYFALSNMYESLLVVSLGMLLGTGLLIPGFGWRRIGQWLGWPVTVLCLATIGFACTLPTQIHPLQAALQSYWRAIHVPIILLSYAMFALSFLLSLLQLTLGKRFNCELLLDEINYRAVILGFPLLALGIILGGLWANEAWGNYWSWDPKESMSLATLLGYGIYLHLRVKGEQSHRVLSWVSVGCFVLLLVTYFGVNLMGLGLHSYGKIG